MWDAVVHLGALAAFVGVWVLFARMTTTAQARPGWKRGLDSYDPG